MKVHRAIPGTAVDIAQAASLQLLNASCDPSRELYRQINPKLEAYWKVKTGQAIVVDTSNDRSGKQARSVLAGLQANVVTLGIASGIDVLHEYEWCALEHCQKPRVETVFSMVAALHAEAGSSSAHRRAQRRIHTAFATERTRALPRSSVEPGMNARSPQGIADYRRACAKALAAVEATWRESTAISFR